MEHTIPYNLSKDYNLLFEIVKAGNRIVCFVDYNFRNSETKPFRDITTITNFNYEAQSRGRGYFGLIDKDDSEEQLIKEFIINCKYVNLEWIVPPQL